MPSTEESKQHCPPPFPMVSPTITTFRHSTCSPEDKNNISNTNTGGIAIIDKSFKQIWIYFYLLLEINNKTNSRNLIPLISDTDTTIPIDRYL